MKNITSFDPAVVRTKKSYSMKGITRTGLAFKSIFSVCETRQSCAQGGTT